MIWRTLDKYNILHWSGFELDTKTKDSENPAVFSEKKISLYFIANLLIKYANGTLDKV